MTRHRRSPISTVRARVTAACLVCSAVLASSGCHDRSDPGLLRVERVLGETGRQPGQFSYPRGLAAFELDGRSVLAVVDKSARIQLIDAATGRPVGLIRTPVFDLGMPTGLTAATHPTDPSRRALWVADTHEHRVLIYEVPFDTGGAPMEPAFSFGSFGNGPGEFIYTTDVAVLDGPDGLPARVFVSEYGGNDRISEFRVRRSGGEVAFEFVRQIGTSGVAMDAPEDDPSALSRPQSVELRTRPADGGLELVVTDVGRHRVVRFDAQTGAVTGWTDGRRAVGGGTSAPLRHPYGVILTDERHAVVAEFGASRLRMIELDTGDTVGFLGGPGRLVGQLATPWATLLVGDELMVLDSGNDRVQVVRWPGVAGFSLEGHPDPGADTSGDRQ